MKKKFKIDLSKIPFISLPDRPLTAPSWNFVPIAEIVDDVILYKSGGAALVMESSSLNFSLLSDKEQEAVVVAYAALLNSLSFSIQILIKSQKKDISKYIEYIDQKAKDLKNPKLTQLMANYKEYILSSIKKKNVLGKRFYIVIPFSPLELGVTKSFLSTIKQSGSLPFPRSYIIKKAKIILYPKRDHLIRQTGRFGVKVRQLTNDELINLFYITYNPEIPSVKVIPGEEEKQQ
jgi:hypothetical protein